MRPRRPCAIRPGPPWRRGAGAARFARPDGHREEGPSWRFESRVFQRVTSRSRRWAATAARASSGWVTGFRKAGMARFFSSAKTATNCQSSEEERGGVLQRSTFCHGLSRMRKPSSARCPQVRAVPLRTRASRPSMRRKVSISAGFSGRPRAMETTEANSLAAVSMGSGALGPGALGSLGALPIRGEVRRPSTGRSPSGGAGRMAGGGRGGLAFGFIRAFRAEGCPVGTGPSRVAEDECVLLSPGGP
jgi:hypothetical protein